MGYGSVGAPRNVIRVVRDGDEKGGGHDGIYHGLLSDRTTCNLIAINKIKGGTTMKKLIIGMLFLVLTSGTVLAGGDQNQGTSGSGSTSTGSSSQGQASQSRSGR